LRFAIMQKLAFCQALDIFPDILDGTSYVVNPVGQAPQLFVHTGTASLRICRR
jgi:hypothetical protein